MSIYISFNISFHDHVGIGDYCRLTSNCAVERTKCQNGQCRCFFRYHPNDSKSKCLKDVNLDERCYMHDECVVEHSYCTSGTCKCKPNFVPSQDNQMCLPLATSLYQSCQIDPQCSSIPNSMCDSRNGTCVCQKDHHDINAVRIIKDSSTTDDQLVTFEISFNFFQRCWSSVRLNGICEADENCVIGHSSCINKRCTCDEGFHETHDKFCSNAEKVQISFLVVALVVFTSSLFV